MRLFWTIFWLAAAALLFDTLFSYLSTCDPQSFPNPYSQSQEHSCSAFRGPFVTGVVFLLNWFGRVLHAYGQAAIAALTIILAGSIIALWRSAEKLARASDRQIGQSEKAAEAVLKSADVAEKKMLAAQRPWISVEMRINESLTYDVNGLRISLLFILKNGGNSPARNVLPTAYVHLPSFMGDGKSVDQEQRNYRAQISGCQSGLGGGITILPGETKMHLVTAIVSRDAIKKSMRLPDQQMASFIYPSIIGIVRYQTTFSEHWHQTSLVAGLYVCEKGRRLALSADEKTTPVAEVVLLNNLAGDYAD
jgi:hypothetical protein